MKLTTATVCVLILIVSCFQAIAAPPSPRELSPAPPGSFSLVVIPDTQQYRGRGTKLTPDSRDQVTNEVFDNHTRWIVENLEQQRIVFVSHVGDIVDRNVPEQWEIARRCMDRLHGKVPYGISVGNHDMEFNGDSHLFQRYFGKLRFADFEWYGGSFEPMPAGKPVSGNNANSYQLFSAEGLDFVVLHLECNAPDDVLAWANEVLTRYAERRAIITTHMDLGPLQQPTNGRGYFTDPKGRMQWTKMHGARGNTAEVMWEKCFRKHANLFMVCSGDQSRTTAMYLKSIGNHGNAVHALLSDYTSTGPLRIYRFLPQASEIQVITYDTTLKKLVYEHPHVPNRDQHQFSLSYPMTR